MELGDTAVDHVQLPVAVAEPTENILSSVQNANTERQHDEIELFRHLVLLSNWDNIPSDIKLRFAHLSSMAADLLDKTSSQETHLLRQQAHRQLQGRENWNNDREISDPASLIVQILQVAYDVRLMIDSGASGVEPKIKALFQTAFGHLAKHCLLHLGQDSEHLLRRNTGVQRIQRVSKALGGAARLVTTGDGNFKIHFSHWLRHIGGVLQVQRRASRKGFSLPRFSFIPQGIIKDNSAAVRACRSGDINTLRELMSNHKFRKVHPNDRTINNTTLLSIAINSKYIEIVEFLLQAGADPNLTYGRFETSPLDRACYLGWPELVRLLINEGADIEYINRRGWTHLFYLWDPKRPSVPCDEILSIMRSLDFQSWNNQDLVGWTLLHRCAAFGNSSSLTSLLLSRAYMDIRSHISKWRAIHCALVYGNLSTFNLLFELDKPQRHGFFPDFNNWTLLHHAAQQGSVSMMARLLRAGADPKILTHSSSSSLPPALIDKEVSVRDIAIVYGNLKAFEQAERESEKGNTEDFIETTNSDILTRFSSAGTVGE